jgi:hypothetical protein
MCKYITLPGCCSAAEFRLVHKKSVEVTNSYRGGFQVIGKPEEFLGIRYKINVRMQTNFLCRSSESLNTLSFGDISGSTVFILSMG